MERFIAQPARQLKVYVVRHCHNCEHARKVAGALARAYADLEVEILDLESMPQDERPEAVFAAPTYLLDGRVWSLGNPSPGKILETFGPPQTGAAGP